MVPTYGGPSELDQPSPANDESACDPVLVRKISTCVLESDNRWQPSPLASSTCVVTSVTLMLATPLFALSSTCVLTSVDFTSISRISSACVLASANFRPPSTSRLSSACVLASADLCAWEALSGVSLTCALASTDLKVSTMGSVCVLTLVELSPPPPCEASGFDVHPDVALSSPGKNRVWAQVTWQPSCWACGRGRIRVRVGHRFAPGMSRVGGLVIGLGFELGQAPEDPCGAPLPSAAGDSALDLPPPAAGASPFFALPKSSCIHMYCES